MNEKNAYFTSYLYVLRYFIFYSALQKTTIRMLMTTMTKEVLLQPLAVEAIIIKDPMAEVEEVEVAAGVKLENCFWNTPSMSVTTRNRLWKKWRL